MAVKGVPRGWELGMVCCLIPALVHIYVYFPIRSDSNQAVQPQGMGRDLKFWTKNVVELYYNVAKTKALICMVTTQLICAFVFVYAKNRFSHDAAHIRWYVRM